MFQRGLVALSADPIHNGHLDLIKEAKSKCQKLLVLISNNDEKKHSYLFSLPERISFARQALAGMTDIEVIESQTEILSDIYLIFGCDALFRGIRDDKDQEYEETQMGYHKMIYPKLNPVYLSFRDKIYLSSTIIKAFTNHHIDVSKYLPIFVKRALEERINKQYKIAVTGGIAVGKSWVTDNLAKLCNLEFIRSGQQSTLPYDQIDQRDLFSSAVKFDDLIHCVYQDLSPGPVDMRQQIESLCLMANCKYSVLNPDGTINRLALAEFIFSDQCQNPNLRMEIQNLTQPFVDVKYREALKKVRPGVVFIEWAQLAEMEMGWLANHNTIVVDSPDRQHFLSQRNISMQQFSERSRFQWTAEQKVKALESNAFQSGNGYIIQFQNTINDNKIQDLVNSVLDFFNFKE